MQQRHRFGRLGHVDEVTQALNLNVGEAQRGNDRGEHLRCRGHLSLLELLVGATADTCQLGHVELGQPGGAAPQRSQAG